MCLVDLFIRRLALPTVNYALHFALECSREVASILLHFLNPQVGHVRSHRLQEILREILFRISYWPNSRSFVFSDYRRREKHAQANCPLLYFYLKQSSFPPHHQNSIWTPTSLGRWVLTDMSRTTTTIAVILKFFYIFQSSISFLNCPFSVSRAIT